MLMVDIACGADLLGGHSIAVSREGAAYTWGNGAALGHGTMGGSNAPKRVQDGDLSRRRVYSVAAGGSFSLAITTRGRLYSWGKWANGRLGLGTIPSVLHHVPGLPQTTGGTTSRRKRKHVPRFLL